MRTAHMLGLFPFVLAALGVAEQTLEPVASALKADDACAGGADCEVSFRQLRGEPLSSEAAEEAEIKAEGEIREQLAMQVSSAFAEGIDNVGIQTCDAKELEGKGKLSSSYMRTNNGITWKSDMVVISVDAQPTMFETITPAKPISLRLGLHFEPGQNTSVVIRGLKKVVPSSLPMESPYCQMARPLCFGKPHCYVSKPEYGWMSADNAIVMPLTGIVSVNVTDIIDQSLGAIQVYVVPPELPANGLWETPEVTVFSWNFFNTGDDSSSKSEDEDDAWW